MAVVEGADGFQWEHNIGEEKEPLAGGATREWWREIEKQSGGWWRITREVDDVGMNASYFLRQWETDESGTRRLLSSNFKPTDTLARSQESARDHELIFDAST